MNIKRHEKYSEPVNIQDVHGEFPYKLYVEVIGTNAYGRYIVIVSSTPFEINDNETVKLHFVGGEMGIKKQIRTRSGTITGNGAIAKRAISSYVEYKGKQVNMVLLKKQGIQVGVYRIVE